MPRHKADVHRIFHALGDPTRRAIVERLSERPVSVSELAKPLVITLAANVFARLLVRRVSGTALPVGRGL